MGVFTRVTVRVRPDEASGGQAAGACSHTEGAGERVKAGGQALLQGNPAGPGDAEGQDWGLAGTPITTTGPAGSPEHQAQSSATGGAGGLHLPLPRPGAGTWRLLPRFPRVPRLGQAPAAAAPPAAAPAEGPRGQGAAQADALLTQSRRPGGTHLASPPAWGVAGPAPPPTSQASPHHQLRQPLELSSCDSHPAACREPGRTPGWRAPDRLAHLPPVRVAVAVSPRPGSLRHVEAPRIPITTPTEQPSPPPRGLAAASFVNRTVDGLINNHSVGPFFLTCRHACPTSTRHPAVRLQP